jgi:hypothetical protein
MDILRLTDDENGKRRRASVDTGWRRKIHAATAQARNARVAGGKVARHGIAA